jgi:hypothetical protein
MLAAALTAVAPGTDTIDVIPCATLLLSKNSGNLFGKPEDRP